MSENNEGTISIEQQLIKDRFEQEKQICSLYIDCAKSYVQISTGALLLSITFYNDIIDVMIKTSHKINSKLLLAAWIPWLLTIVIGVTYQYSVVKYLEDIADKYKLLTFKRTWKWFFLKKFREEPYLLYGTMIFFFYTAILIFSILAFIAIS